MPNMSTSKHRIPVVSENQKTLTSYITQSKGSPNPTAQLKHNISNLSPPEIEPSQKKANMDSQEIQKAITQTPAGNGITMPGQTNIDNGDTTTINNNEGTTTIEEMPNCLLTSYVILWNP